jgi:hypothetical protein
VLLTGCPSTDTLLGLEAIAGDASVVVTGDVVEVSIDVDYRNGAHTEGARMFQPMLVEVYAADAPVAQMPVEIPPDTDLDLAPGESASATFSGMSDPGEANDPARLCDGARVLLRWIDGTTRTPAIVEADVPAAECE